MPLMIDLKNYITTLMESAMIILNKEKTSLIDISPINENLYVSLHSQLYNKTKNVCLLKYNTYKKIRVRIKNINHMMITITS